MANKTNNSPTIPFLLPIRSILFVVIFLIMSSISKLPYTAISKWWTAVAVVGNIITMAILYFYCHRQGITYAEMIHYQKGKTKLKPMVLIVSTILTVGMGGLLLSGVICYGTFPYLDKIMVEPIALWLAIIILMLLPLTTTLAEDGLYLGYAINCTANSKWAVVLPSAFFYAIQHSFIPFLPDGIFILYRFLSFLPITVIMCMWYQKNRNPLPFMVGHLLLNIATAVQILMMSLSPDLYNTL